MHVSQINEWKRQLLTGLPQVFDRKGERREAANEAEKDRLYRQIGKNQVERDWLKKRRDISDERARETGVYRSRTC